MNIIVTGGLGFIGFNFVLQILKKSKNYNIYIIDNFSYSALTFLKTKIEIINSFSNVTLLRGNIVNFNFKDIIQKYSIRALINFASETHVDNSIKSPNAFFKSNIMGTANILNNLLELRDEKKNLVKFIHISTDEVFGHLDNIEKKFNINSKIDPRNPYSASKGAAELLINSYRSTFDLNAIKINCCNNYGPYQHFEKLIPKTIQKLLKNQKVPIYGDGKNIREWIYVEDFCDGITKILNSSTLNYTRYLFGSNLEIENISMLKKIFNKLTEFNLISKNFDESFEFVTDRLGHDFRYSIDSSLTSSEIDWKPKTNFENGLEKTIKFYLENQI